MAILLCPATGILNLCRALLCALRFSVRFCLRRAFKPLQVLLVAVSLLGTAAQAGDHPLQVDNPTILLPVKTAQVVAGFAELINHANTELRVTGISSVAFGRSELHRTVVENDVAKMRKQDAIVIPAHSKLTLQHGGLHMMLMQPKQELSDGDEIVVNFEFDTGKSLPVSFKVSSDIATGAKHGQDGHAGHGDSSDHGDAKDKKNHNKHKNH